MHSRPARSPRVGLVGFYGQGLFADDLMAVIFGLFLKRMGVSFSVYRLCKPYAEKFGFPVMHSVEEFLEDAQVLLWGGGGLLVPWSRLVHELFFPNVGADYSRLIDNARARGIPMYACSVGGSGDHPTKLTPSYKQSFLDSAKYISVRNPQDLPLLRRTGIDGDFFPDIIWQTASQFPVQHRRGKVLRIGMDIYAGDLLRRNALHLLPIIQEITKMRSDCEFIFTDTTNRSVKSYRGLGRWFKGGNIRSFQFSELAKDIELLASLDLLVTTRLHTPLVCMQYQVPTISLCGAKKTKLIFENLNLLDAYYDHGRVDEFRSLMLSKSKLAMFMEAFRFPDTAHLMEGSSAHLEKVREILS